MKQTKEQRDTVAHYCNHCNKEYIPAIIQKIYGKESMVALLGYCSAECYTKSQQQQETASSNDSLEKQKIPFFIVQNDKGEFYAFHGMESLCRKDYEDSKEDGETETFFDWCMNSYDIYHLNNYNALKQSNKELNNLLNLQQWDATFTALQKLKKVTNG